MFKQKIVTLQETGNKIAEDYEVSSFYQTL